MGTSVSRRTRTYKSDGKKRYKKTGIPSKQKGSDNNRSICIEQYSKEGKLLNTYGSVREAERISGISRSTINRSLKNNYKPAGGYIWKEKDNHTY